MSKYRISLAVALLATVIMLAQSGLFAQQEQSQAGAQPPAPSAQAPAAQAQQAVDIKIDKTSLDNGGDVAISGVAPAGKPVFIEVWAEQEVRVSRFDSQVDKETGKRPYILYMTNKMPAYFKILVPADKKETLESIKKLRGEWSYPVALKDLGADVAYSAPAKADIERYQASLLGSVIGSRGELLPKMDEKETRRRSMQLVKARFRNAGTVFIPNVDIKADGSYAAKIPISQNAAPGKYYVRAVVDGNAKSQTLSFENKIAFPYLYMSNAGTSMNLFYPFFLSLAISIFGVLMGAGGGFILNPLLVSLWPLPHTVVAGTVMPTVLFGQGSGIVNYSKIKFINWRLGASIGLAMLLGAFIGPKLTEMMTLDQYKFVFGWILIVLAGLMLWQTMPGYLLKNKKEQAIVAEYKKKAQQAAVAGA